MYSEKIPGIIFFIAIGAYCSAYENDVEPEYGDRWFLFLDENGTTHKVNFTSLPLETRGFFFGKVYCYLYTRQNTDQGELLTPSSGNSAINSSYFNLTNDIKAVTHGWLSSANSDWVQNVKETLLKAYDLNVLLVDWSEIARNPLYPWPAFSTRYVGKHIAKVLNSLRRTYDVSPNVHLIGHSLGAQVMGYVDMFYDGQVHRVTGLDPARPLFEIPLMPPEWRLEKSDAAFVDIIHTCAGIYGYKRSHGHADFYPNSGKAPQPGCDGIRQEIDSCSHGRAHAYFLESISSEIGFFSYPCENWEEFRNEHCKTNPTLMGYPASTSFKGDFYLNTNNESEYACGE